MSKVYGIAFATLLIMACKGSPEGILEEPVHVAPILVPGDNSTSSLVTSIKVVGPFSVKIIFAEEMNEDSVQEPLNLKFDPNLPIDTLTLDHSKKELTVLTQEFIIPRKITVQGNGWTTQKGFIINSFKANIVSNNMLAFVTLAQGNGDFSTWPNSNGKTGIEAANENCRVEAANAGYEGNFVAWIADSSSDPSALLGNSSGARYNVKINRTKANLWIRDISDFDISQTLAVLNGASDGNLMYTGKVFTGINEMGQKLSNDPAAFCNNWTSSQSSQTHAFRDVSRTAAFWMTPDSAALNCGSTARLYCIQKGKTETREFVPEVSAKKVFLTSVVGSGNLLGWSDATGATSGIDAADKICRARATAAGLGNATQFKAWISTSTEVNFTRFPAGSKYMSPFGLLLANDVNELRGVIAVPVSWDEFGEPVPATRDRFHSGATAVSFSNCAGWTSTTETVPQTSVGKRIPVTTTGNCSDQLPLLCVES